MLKSALSRWIVPVCYWNRPELEREMLSLVSTGLTYLPAKRNEKTKERSSMGSAVFYPIYQPTPLGQDMTQGQFLSGV